MILAAFAVLLAAFVRSVSGFGYALVATPLLTLVFEPKPVVVINIILGSFINVLVLFYTRRHVDLKKVVFICLGSIAGVPLGAYLLSRLEPSIIKLAIAALVIPFSVLLLLGHSHRFKRETLGCSIAGFMGGILGASTSFAGPPVVLFLLNQGLVKEKFVGTLAAYFLFTGVISIGAFSSLGMITTDLLTKVAIFLPTLWLGSYAGIKLLPRIDTTLFRRIASSLVSVAALAIIVTVLTDL